MVHQQGYFSSIGPLKARQEDIPRGHQGRIRAEEMARLCIHQLETAAAVQQRHVNPAGIRRIKVHNLIVQLTERRILEQAPQGKGIFHFGQADGIRKPALLRSGPEDALGNGVALGLEALPGPAPVSPGRKLPVRSA